MSFTADQAAIYGLSGTALFLSALQVVVCALTHDEAGVTAALTSMETALLSVDGSVSSLPDDPELVLGGLLAVVSDTTEAITGAATDLQQLGDNTVESCEILNRLGEYFIRLDEAEVTTDLEYPDTSRIL